MISMKSARRLEPVVVKQRAKQQAFALIARGYVQGRETVNCSQCSLRFLLLVDRRDRNIPGGQSTVVHEEAVEYFLMKVKADHKAGHPHDQFAMPPFIRSRASGANLVETCCVLCRKKIGASKVEPKLAAIERAHNCSLGAIRVANAADNRAGWHKYVRSSLLYIQQSNGQGQKGAP